MTLTTSSILDQLNAQLNTATTRLTEARKALRAAERKEEQASDAVAAIGEQISIEQLRLWGDKPDLAVMLAKDRSYTFYRALGVLAEAFGMGVGGDWADTRQCVLSLSLNRGEHGAVERVAAGVRTLPPPSRQSRAAGLDSTFSSEATRAHGSCDTRLSARMRCS